MYYHMLHGLISFNLNTHLDSIDCSNVKNSNNVLKHDNKKSAKHNKKLIKCNQGLNTQIKKART